MTDLERMIEMMTRAGVEFTQRESSEPKGVVFGSVTAFNPDRGWFETYVPEDDHGRQISYPRPEGGSVMDRGRHGG